MVAVVNSLLLAGLFALGLRGILAMAAPDMHTGPVYACVGVAGLTGFVVMWLFEGWQTMSYYRKHQPDAAEFRFPCGK